MTVEKAYEYINDIASRGSVPGLDSIFSMLDKIGSPQNSFRVIHVTGTNGKGSFCSMMSAILMEKGYKVGVFSSPHLVDIRECITVNGDMISEDELASLTSRLSLISESLENPLTQFEFITALCFEYFRSCKVDIAVVEVGMGGRLDATNVFDSSLLSVITGIAFDHVSWLGNSLEDIAKEKSGIIKKGCCVYYGGADGPAEEIIRNKSISLEGRYFRKDDNLPEVVDLSFDGTVFEYKKNRYTLSVAGEYQVDNAVKVIDCCDILNRVGFNIQTIDINKGLSKVKRNARFEVVSKTPVVIYDGGHNPECAEALVRSVKCYFGDEKVDVIMGVLADKEYHKMAKMISEIAARVYTITPDNPRALSSSILCDVYKELMVPAFDCGGYDNALEKWRSNGKSPLIVTGSLYSYKDFLSCFKNANEK